VDHAGGKDWAATGAGVSGLQGRPRAGDL